MLTNIFVEVAHLKKKVFIAQPTLTFAGTNIAPKRPPGPKKKEAGSSSSPINFLG